MNISIWTEIVSLIQQIPEVRHFLSMENIFVFSISPGLRPPSKAERDIQIPDPAGSLKENLDLKSSRHLVKGTIRFWTQRSPPNSTLYKNFNAELSGISGVEISINRKYFQILQYIPLLSYKVGKFSHTTVPIILTLGGSISF